MSKAISNNLVDHPVTAYVNSLSSPQSKRAMGSALRSVLALALGVETSSVEGSALYEFHWGNIDAARMEAIKASLLERYSPRMAAKCFTAVRGVMRYCFMQNLIDADRWMRIQLVKGVKVDSNQKTGRRLSDGEMRSLAKVCADDLSPAGARDDAIIGLGFTQGPRIAEVVGFQLEDYDPATGDLIIHNGKGGKARTIRASNSTKESLDEWIALRGDEPGPLFCRVNKGGAISIAPLTVQALGLVLTKRAEAAGVKSFTFHDLRRTFITNGWAIGIPGSQLQTLAGHSSMATTASYDRGDLETALKSSERLHYPSMRRQK